MATFKCNACGKTQEADEAPECCGNPMGPAEEAPSEAPAESSEAPAEESSEEKKEE